MKRLISLLALSVAVILPATAQDKTSKPPRNPQAQSASKTVHFGTLPKTDAKYQKALDAHKLADAKKLIGKSGSFKGKVSKLFAPRSGDLVILNFDPDYKTALVAVVPKKAFSAFPDLSSLVGKEAVIQGKFLDYHDTPEVEITKPDQVLLVK